MFDQLFEKLKKANEAVATADPQKLVKDYYKGKPTELTLSTWPSAREEHEYKFWLLQDGTVIPVTYSHALTITDAGVRGGRYGGRNFMETGAVVGAIHNVTDELTITASKGLTEQQISQLRNLSIEHKVTSIVAEIGRKGWRSSVKSSKHLDYLLNYGPDVTEVKEVVDKEKFDYMVTYGRSAKDELVEKVKDASLLEKCLETTILQDMGRAGFISPRGKIIEFNPEEEHEDRPVPETDIPKGSLEFRIFPVGYGVGTDTLILRLREKLTPEQVLAINTFLRDTDYTVEYLEISLLQSSDWPRPKNIKFGMSKHWPAMVRKMYEAKNLDGSLLERCLETTISKLGSCMLFAENKVKELLFKGIEDFVVVEGYVYLGGVGRENTTEHTWIELSNGKKIDDTIDQFKHWGYERDAVEYSPFDRKEYSPKEYLELCTKYPVSKPVEEAAEVVDDKEKLDYFLKRTHLHIGLVQAAAAKIAEVYPEEFGELVKQTADHDASKLQDPELTPYIEITWRHKLEKENDEFDPIKDKGYKPPGKLDKKEEDAAVLHHIKNNSHHPEYWLADQSKANLGVDTDDSIKCVDASRMPPINLAEMVADWQAMSEELGTNTVKEWFNKVRDTRFSFTKDQEALIDKLLKIFE